VNRPNSIRAHDENPAGEAKESGLDPRIGRVIAIIDADPHQRLSLPIMARIQV
jgi:hypothetical protein